MTCCPDWTLINGWKYFGSVRPDFRNPVQGIWNNCQFIAGLSSVCWVHPQFIKDASDGKYYFWDEATSAKCEVRINPELFVVNPLAFSPSFCGAKSNQFDTTTELWPALYEKAYAKFCFYKKGLISAANLSDPDFWPLNAAGKPLSPCTLSNPEWGGNPIMAMLRITGCNGISYSIYEKNANGSPNRDKPIKFSCGAVCPDTTDIYKFVYTCFCQKPQGTYKTRRPMAAWTYAQEECIDLQTGQVIRYLPDDCHYTPNGIQINHSYSILGVFEPGDENGNQYIILRDPCGIDPSDLTIQDKIYTGPTPWTPLNKWFVLCPQGINPTSEKIGIPNKYSIFLSDQDGVFGLLASEFSKYFECIGWLI